MLDPRRSNVILLSFAAVSLWALRAPCGDRQLPTNSPLDETRLEEGIRLISSARFEEALAAFNEFKQTAPQDPRPYFYSGMALQQAGRLSAAASEMTEAVRLAPDRPDYRVFQANIFSRLKQNVAALNALAIFKKEGSAKQLETPWLRLLADVYFRLEQIDDCMKILDLLSERSPEDARTDLDRGQVYLATGKPDLALDSFQKSIAKSDHNPMAYFELGKILYQRNELAASKKALLRAVEQVPDNPEYVYKLGTVCLARGEVEEAIEYLKRAEPSGPALPQVYNALGRAYQRKGDRRKGDEYRKKFQEATSTQRHKEDQNRTADRFIAQGERQLDQGNKAAAQALFEQAAQADPNRWDPHGYLAEMFLASGDLERAHPHLVKMEKIDPESVVGNFLMANYWYKRKDLERACAYAEKAKRSRPGNSEIRNLLGNIYLGLGQKERAVQEFETAVRLAPDRADFREALRKVENLPPETTPQPLNR